MRNFKVILAVLLALCTAALTGCTGEAYEATITAMDTVMNFEIYGAHAEEALPMLKELSETYDKLFSNQNENSDISHINTAQGQPATVDEATFDIISKSAELCRATDGALDITVYPLTDAWGFEKEKQRIPDGDEIDALMPLVNFNLIQMDRGYRTVAVPDGVQIGLGAVAKGYLADQAVELMKENKVRYGLLNFGGTVAAFGRKLFVRPWKIGIADPANPSDYFGYVQCTDKFLATSGGYERFFIGEDGEKYIHIIDPVTGRTVDNGIESVTVIADDGITADALSTALFVKGLVGAQNYWLEHRDFDFVILDEWGTVYVTEGIKRKFSLSDSHANLEIVEINDDSIG